MFCKAITINNCAREKGKKEKKQLCKRVKEIERILSGVKIFLTKKIIMYDGKFSRNKKKRFYKEKASYLLV